MKIDRTVARCTVGGKI
uniref:Uncharacterized protein n=1 Tax=Anopheles albimanus TaxID=7167 RepID=A0A182FXR3_ANOAL